MNFHNRNLLGKGTQHPLSRLQKRMVWGICFFGGVAFIPLIASEPVLTHLDLLGRVVDETILRHFDPAWVDSGQVVWLIGPDYPDLKVRWIEGRWISSLMRQGLEVYTGREALPMGLRLIWLPLEVSVRYTGTVRRSWRSSLEVIRVAACRFSIQAVQMPSGRVLAAGEWVHGVQDTIQERLLPLLEAEGMAILGKPERPEDLGLRRFVELFFMMALLFVTGYAFFTIRTRT